MSQGEDRPFAFYMFYFFIFHHQSIWQTSHSQLCQEMARRRLLMADWKLYFHIVEFSFKQQKWCHHGLYNQTFLVYSGWLSLIQIKWASGASVESQVNFVLCTSLLLHLSWSIQSWVKIEWNKSAIITVSWWTILTLFKWAFWVIFISIAFKAQRVIQKNNLYIPP